MPRYVTSTLHAAPFCIKSFMLVELRCTQISLLSPNRLLFEQKKPWAKPQINPCLTELFAKFNWNFFFFLIIY